MKIKDLNDMRKKDIKQLTIALNDKKEELRKVNLDMSLGQESNSKKAKLIKKDIAQIMTIVREKLLIEETQPSEVKEEKGEK